jgi:hypothetical protein
MLPLIADEIRRAAGEAKVDVIEVGMEESVRIRDTLRTKFARDPRFELTCNNFADYSALHHQDAWLWIGEILGHEPVLLFYDSSLDTKRRPDHSMFLVSSGSDVVRILEECHGFVFYVTNQDLDYVVCHNSHDVLLGAGSGKAIVLELGARHGVRVTS